MPERIGPYPVLREIGSGGMGCVYAAQQACPVREVAVKVIKDGVFADAALRARFLAEREIAGSFEHPNIIRVYDAGEDADGQLYYVMELAQRGTLTEFMRAEPLPPRQAVRLMIEVAFAVDYAHRKGVLHRDLKPDNILIGEDRRARVTDFGVARVVLDADAQAPSESTLVGSYPYMAPEQAGLHAGAAAPAASPASDIYSLGAIVYELVYGAPPYPVRTRDDLLSALNAGPLTPPTAADGVNYDLQAVILKALAHGPAQRYASAAQLAEDLRRTLGGRATVARSPSLRGRIASALSHHAAWFSILVAALAISGAAVQALNQGMVRTRLREHANLQRQTQRTAAAIERIFKHVAGVSRQLASDSRSVELLLRARGPDTTERPWIERLARDNDLVNTAFILSQDGLPVAHFPREPDSYYKLTFQRRVYFRGAQLSVQQGLNLAVFVSPLFQSRAADALTKLAFSAPVLGPDKQQLGVAVATVALDKLTREVAHPALTLIAPREVELSDGRSTNTELVRVQEQPQGQPILASASSGGRQLYVANVARTDYAVVAKLEDPPLTAVRLGLLALIMSLAALCVLALFLVHRARTQHDA